MNSAQPNDSKDSNTLPSVEVNESGTGESAPLTPLLCLAASLLYMIKADGQIDEHESSQIQATLGGNEDILGLGLDYVATTPLAEFLTIAPPLLNQKETLCILTNICDSLLSDGVVSDDEKVMFEQFCIAFEVSEAAFAPYNNALKFKNNKLKLGLYSQEALSSPFPPAHLSLAACLLYMMAADGDIAEEEMGQLQVVIGEFEGLQEAAMQQVRCMKISQFLRQSAPYLTEDQKIFILVNVYDSMLSDGISAEKEQLLFDNIQDAFAISGNKLAPFLKAIEVKNFKPKVTQMDRDAIHTRKKRQKEHDDQWGISDQSLATRAQVQRTMNQNIKQVSEGFSSQEDIDLVSLNANNQDPRLKIKEGQALVNVQQIEEAGIKTNRQQVGTDALKDNLQALDDERYKDNLQALPDDFLASQEGQFFAGERMNSLQQNITTVHQQLDQITPRSTWQKLDAFFKKRPLPLTDLEVTSLPLSLDEKQALHSTDPQAFKLPFENPALFNEAEAEQKAEAEAEALAETQAEAEFNAAGIDGGIRLRTLLLTFGISIPLFGYAYGLIYPTMVCQGPTHQWQQWTPDGETGETKTINDQLTTERHLIQIRRGEVNVTNQRFPLYKELNQSNHFAQQTEVGFKGGYSTQTVDQMKYVFEYLRDNNQLNIQSQSAGIRYIDGQSGRIEVFSVFKGQCDNRWF